MSSSREKINFVNSRLSSLLEDIRNPNSGLTVEGLTKLIWPSWESFRPVEFRREAKYIERRIRGIRRNVWRELEEGELIPSFLPHALPTTKDSTAESLVENIVEEEEDTNPIHWKYFNAIEDPWISNVAVLMYKRSQGLYMMAQKIERIFGIDVGERLRWTV